MRHATQVRTTVPIAVDRWQVPASRMAWQLAPPIKCAVCHYHSMPCTVSGFRSAITDAPQIGKKPRSCPDRHGDGRKRRAGRVDLEDLIGQAKEVSSWSAWRDYIAGLG